MGHIGVYVFVAVCLFVPLISIPSTLVTSITAVIADDADDTTLSLLAVQASPGGLWQVSMVAHVH